METKEQTLRGKIEALKTSIDSLDEFLHRTGKRAAHAEYQRDELTQRIDKLISFVEGL